MCLAVPGKVLCLDGNIGTVEIGNMKIKVFMHLVTDVAVNEYVLVHAGCAIEKIDEKQAKITLDFFKELTQNEIC